MTTIYLKKNKEESLLRFHPWVFSGAIAHINGKPQEGEMVEVRSAEGQTLGIGHWQEGSIAVRILEFGTGTLPSDFWHQRLLNALQMRQSLGLISDENNSYRLIHGEGDFLPGLIIDIYGSTAVVQAHSAGMHLARHQIADALTRTVPNLSHVYYKSEGTLPFHNHLTDIKNEYLAGSPSSDSSHIATENGLHFSIDWVDGQKTGFFVDQRENRMLVERYSKNRDVLNMFCYTGGFSVYALRGGAKRVVSVDSSEKAVRLAEQNVLLNFPDCTNHETVCSDAFKYLDSLHADNDKFDLIILDPPAFAKHRGAIRNALQGYKRLNAKGFEKISKGGILFTFSCSQAIDKEMFRLAVFSAAAMSGRKVRILHQLTQPQDHPINIYHPEGEYLKGLVLYVE